MSFMDPDLFINGFKELKHQAKIKLIVHWNLRHSHVLLIHAGLAFCQFAIVVIREIKAMKQLAWKRT